MNFIIISAIGFAGLLTLTSVQGMRINSLKKDVTDTKSSLYDCRIENKELQSRLNEQEKSAEEAKLRLEKSLDKNKIIQNESNQKIGKIIATEVSDDCNKTSRWAAIESQKIAKVFNSDQN